MAHIKSRYADVTGDGTGNHHATGDYSDATGAGETIFKVKPGAGEIFSIERMIVFIRTDGKITADKYGIAITLINGIILKSIRDTPADAPVEVWDITDGDPILTNSDWKKLCHDEILSDYGAPNTGQNLSYRYTFSKDGHPMVLEGDNGEELQIILNDDYTDLVDHTFRIGMIEI
jgi:hypothetical protein